MHLHFFLILTVEDPDDVKFSTVLDEGKITVFRCRVRPCDITAACPGCFFLQNQTMEALAENDFSSNAIRFDSCTAPSRSAIIQDQNASISTLNFSVVSTSLTARSWTLWSLFPLSCRKVPRKPGPTSLPCANIVSWITSVVVSPQFLASVSSSAATAARNSLGISRAEAT